MKKEVTIQLRNCIHAPPSEQEVVETSYSGLLSQQDADYFLAYQESPNNPTTIKITPCSLEISRKLPLPSRMKILLEKTQDFLYPTEVGNLPLSTQGIALSTTHAPQGIHVFCKYHLLSQNQLLSIHELSIKIKEVYYDKSSI